MSKKCGWITSSGRRCVRRCDGNRCYQHKQRETQLEDIGDYAILKSLSFIFPSGIPRKDFLDLFSKLSNDKKRYFLKELGLDTRMTLDDLDKMFYKKVIELQDIPENAEILITLNNKKRKPLSIKDAVMNLIINLGRIPGDLLCMFLVFGLRVTNWIHRAR